MANDRQPLSDTMIEITLREGLVLWKALDRLIVHHETTKDLERECRTMQIQILKALQIKLPRNGKFPKAIRDMMP